MVGYLYTQSSPCQGFSSHAEKPCSLLPHTGTTIDLASTRTHHIFFYSISRASLLGFLDAVKQQLQLLAN